MKFSKQEMNYLALCILNTNMDEMCTVDFSYRADNFSHFSGKKIKNNGRPDLEKQKTNRRNNDEV